MLLDTAALGDASTSPPVVDLASIRRPEPAAQMRADEGTPEADRFVMAQAFVHNTRFSIEGRVQELVLKGECEI